MPPLNLSAADMADAPFIGPLAAEDATITDLGGAAPNVTKSIVVNEWHASCPHTETLTPVGKEAMLMYNGTLYIHDRRMQMIENTLESPANESAAKQGSHASCPSVPRTFLNAHTCVRTAACAPVRYTSAMLNLSETNLRMYWEKAGIPVYIVRGLRAESPVPSPCSWNTKTPVVHRWQRLGVGCTPTPLDNETATTLVRSIEEVAAAVGQLSHALAPFRTLCSLLHPLLPVSQTLRTPLQATDESNPIVRDVLTPSDGDCADVVDGVEALGATVVDSNGTCWQVREASSSYVPPSPQPPDAL